MYKTLIKLKDGTEISSGASNRDYIRDSSIKEAVNSGSELSLGSACSTEVVLNLVSIDDTVNITAGDDILVYKVDDKGTRTRIGLFTAEKPTKTTAHSYKVVAYDRVSWLDKDVTPWLATLTEWPYPLKTFAKMVCTECGLNFITEDFPNADFSVARVLVNSVTGRKLMEWVGQIAARFIRANVNGDIEMGWYEPADIHIRPNGDRYYYEDSLKYEDYMVASIDAVQIRLASNEYGLLWPAAPAGSNVYQLTGNKLIAEVTVAAQESLEVIKQAITGNTYKPCKISLPASMDIHAGQIIKVTTRKGETFTTWVMSKIQKGNKDTIECVGSARRDRISAGFNATDEDLKDYASEQAQAAVKQQTQLDIFNKLTDNGAVQGLFIEANGQIYVNASYIKTGSLNADLIKSGTLNADLIKAGVLQSEDGESFVLDLINNTFSMRGTGKFMSEDKKSYMTVDGGSFVLNTLDQNGDWMAIAKIGYSEDTDGVDYPYMLLGHAVDSAEEKNLALIKSFANGVYIGNAVPRNNAGNFVGLAGAVGFFMDLQTQDIFRVSGTELQDTVTAVFG